MDSLLARPLGAVLTSPPARSAELACVRPLRIAAATLSHSSRTDVSATTVVAVVGPDDLPALHTSVAAIAAEYDLDVRVRTRAGAYAVRFSRR